MSDKNGELTFRTPRGQIVAPAPAMADRSVAGCLSGSRGIDAATLGPNGVGGPIDYDLAVFALAGRRERRVGSLQPA